MSALDKRQPPRSSACHWTITATLVTLMITACLSNLNWVKNDLVHVVNIQVNRGAGKPIPICPFKCTGTLITSTMVLTAASCTEHDDERKFNSTNKIEITKSLNSSVKTIVSKSRKVRTKDKSKTLKEELNYMQTHGIPVNKGSIQVYLSLPSSRYERNVVRKFLHSDWDWKTKVADLVLLKLNSHFTHYFRTQMHNLIDTDIKRVPFVLRFKGFGKINLKLYSEQPVDDFEANRYLRVNFTDKICPSIDDNSMLNDDLNWWSFLCTPSQYTHNSVEETLCNEDIGGPLYDVENGLPRLYGVFSHAYHVENQLCATQLCYVRETAPYPCETERRLLYYKHTALFGRFAYWVNETVETEYRAEVTTPTCPTERYFPKETTTTTTPVDQLYDVDVYEGKLVMMANYKVCPRHRASSATAVAATASAAVVVGATMLATRS